MAIISNEHNFIFIRNKKTASSSLSIALRPFLGASDIASPITSPKPSVNVYAPLNNVLEDIHTIIGPHIGWREIEMSLNISVADYFSFAFERNPWDKVVSWYWFVKTSIKPDIPSFDEWVKELFKVSVVNKHRHTYVKASIIQDFRKYSDDDDNLKLNFVGRYENLEADFAYICNEIGISCPTLTTEKGGCRQDDKHYREYYTNLTAEMVRNFFHKEIDHFSYSF